MNAVERNANARVFFERAVECGMDNAVGMLPPGDIWDQAQPDLELIRDHVRGARNYGGLIEGALVRFAYRCAVLGKKSGQSLPQFFEACLGIMDCKGQDYAKEKDAYRNFTDAAVNLGITTRQSVFVHAEKHIGAVATWVERGSLAGEPIDMKCLDVCNYCAILHAWSEWEAVEEGVLECA